MTIKAINLFAGVGGICLCFKNNGVEIVYANDFDRYACQIYRANFSHLLFEGDIKSIDTNTIPDADILPGGSPC
ncbi:MAG: DNA cytosine methyltransferase [Rickettsiales bacterium]|nr:DNA cytosine methyltransferase [Rickettsiales bacterium]